MDFIPSKDAQGEVVSRSTSLHATLPSSMAFFFNKKAPKSQKASKSSHTRIRLEIRVWKEWRLTLEGPREV